MLRNLAGGVKPTASSPRYQTLAVDDCDCQTVQLAAQRVSGRLVFSEWRALDVVVETKAWLGQLLVVAKHSAWARLRLRTSPASAIVNRDRLRL